MYQWESSHIAFDITVICNLLVEVCVICQSVNVTDTTHAFVGLHANPAVITLEMK